MASKLDIWSAQRPYSEASTTTFSSGSSQLQLGFHCISCAWPTLLPAPALLPVRLDGSGSTTRTSLRSPPSSCMSRVPQVEGSRGLFPPGLVRQQGPHPLRWIKRHRRSSATISSDDSALSLSLSASRS
eukprot:scaffold2329_cov247-Pinguiococcus_pyrenoidosus.AAC.10